MSAETEKPSRHKSASHPHKGKGKGKSSRAGGRKPLKTRQEFSAGFVLFRIVGGQRFYLLLDYGKHWDYPKGHLEEGETAWQAAVRELREETGIRQVDRVGKFQRDMHYAFFSSKKGPIHKTVTYFTGQTKTEKVQVSDEHTGYEWLPYEQAMERLTYDNARDMLSAAHRAIEAMKSPRTK